MPTQTFTETVISFREKRSFIQSLSDTFAWVDAIPMVWWSLVDSIPFTDILSKTWRWIEAVISFREIARKTWSQQVTDAFTVGDDALQYRYRQIADAFAILDDMTYDWLRPPLFPPDIFWQIAGKIAPHRQERPTAPVTPSRELPTTVPPVTTAIPGRSMTSLAITPSREAPTVELPQAVSVVLPKVEAQLRSPSIPEARSLRSRFVEKLREARRVLQSRYE